MDYLATFLKECILSIYIEIELERYYNLVGTTIKRPYKIRALVSDDELS